MKKVSFVASVTGSQGVRKKGKILDALRHQTNKIVKSRLRRVLADDLSFLNQANVLYAGNGYLSGMEILEP